MQIVGSRFELQTHVATGGMGHVYRALDTSTGETVAVKILHTQNEARSKQFLQEARILEELRHPGIVRHIAHGSTEHGAPYLAMEWLEGENLGQKLNCGPLAPRDALTLGARIASALSAAHRRGIVHRDVKPQNIFLQNRSPAEARLVDFGVAHLASEATSPAEGDFLVGTPAYMAPEQIRSAPLDQRIDIFALGCVLFECLTGEPPWRSQSNVAILAKILFEEPPPLRQLLPSLPASIASFIGRMLEKDRARRPADALALAAELEGLASLDESDRASEASLPPPSLTMTENRLVCVVLARGESAADIAAIEKTYAARVEGFIDGTIAAVMQGALEATDLASRAARCAIALRHTLGNCKIALSTGRAVVTDAVPMGEAIEAAAALFSQEPDEQGRIRIDEPTKSLIERRFEVAEDNRSFLLTEERKQQDEARQLLGQKTPCVGRKAELHALQSAFARSLGTPEAIPVLVTGVAGSGKSRLWHELEVDIRQTSAEIWLTRGDPIRQGARLAMLGQAIRQAASIHDGDSTEVAQAKLKARVHKDTDNNDTDRIAVFLGEVCGVHFPDEHHLQLKAARSDAMLMADQMRRAFEDFLHAATRARPIALVLEDLQWSDLPTVQFVDSALRIASDRPFFVLAMARPEVDQVFRDLWVNRHASRIALSDLPLEASRALIYAVLGRDLPEETVNRIATVAGGNPFALEELIRAVAEGNDTDLPQSVLAVAQSRLEALPEEERFILRAASIFGDPFASAGVRALLGSKGHQVDAILSALTHREVLVHDTSHNSLESTFSFRHSLLREAAYAMLTDENRALGHKLAAEWLAKAGEPNALMLAQHYHRGGDGRSAAKEYARAAEQALEASDLNAVLAHAAQAADCGARGEDLAHLRLLEATAYHWKAEYEKCERAALDALQRAKPVTVGWYRAAGELAEALLPLGKIEPLSAMGKALVPPPGKGAAARAFVMTAATVAMQLLLAGQHEIGQTIMQRMETVEARLVDPGPLVRARGCFARATKAMVAGDFGRALEQGNRSADSYDEAGDIRNAVLMRCNLAYLNMELGGYEAAETTLRAASERAHRIGLPGIAIAAEQNLSYALALGGHIDEGKGKILGCIAGHAALSDLRMIGTSRTYLAQMHLLSGHTREAIEEASAALAVLQSVPNVRAFGLATLASAYLKAGQLDSAISPATEALALLESLGSLDQGDAFVRLVYARVMLEHGQKGEALRVARLGRDDILRKAAKIADPYWAKSFLGRVRENAALIALASELEQP